MDKQPPRGIGIGELARRTGVAEETLRAWERRYGLLRPERTIGGHRRYGDADLARVLQVLRLRRTGLPTSLAAAQVTATSRTETGPSRSGASPSRFRQRLWAATAALDGAAVAAALGVTAQQLTTAEMLDEVVVPVMRQLGDGWRQGPRRIAQEHLASTIVRSWLVARLAEATDPAAPAMVVACPDGELHDLGAIMAAVALADAGWRPVVLGASTPWASAATVIAELAAPLVLIGATTKGPLRRLLDQWQPPRDCAVIVGGAGVEASDVTAWDHAALHHGSYRDLPGAADAVLVR